MRLKYKKKKTTASLPVYVTVERSTLMNEILFCSEPRLVPSFEEPYSAESADWKGGDPAAVSDKDRKRLAWIFSG